MAMNDKCAGARVCFVLALSAVAGCATTSGDHKVGHGGVKSEARAPSATPVVVDRNGGQVLGGAVTGVSLTGEDAPSRRPRAYVRRFSADNKATWTRTFSGEGRHRVTSLVLDQQDNVYVAGVFNGSVSLDGKELSSWRGNKASADGLFLAKLDGGTGKLLWLRLLATSTAAESVSIALGADGILRGAIAFVGDLQIDGKVVVESSLQGRVTSFAVGENKPLTIGFTYAQNSYEQCVDYVRGVDSHCRSGFTEGCWCLYRECASW